MKSKASKVFASLFLTFAVPSFAQAECHCDENCRAQCAEGNHENCHCQDCDCSHGGACENHQK